LTTNAAQVFVAGSGRFLPQTTVDNFQLYEMDSIRSAFDVEAARASLRDIEEGEAAGLDAAQVFDRWSVQVTGIRKRRIMDPDIDESAEHMCAEAARVALSDAGMQASDLDFLFVASCWEYRLPRGSFSTPRVPGSSTGSQRATRSSRQAPHGTSWSSPATSSRGLPITRTRRRPCCSETAPVRSY
jgi:3-oxoacyl-[acyl-carrier-protein] synthase III